MNLQNLRVQLQDTLALTGLSQVEFAMRHGISYSYINKFLKGHMGNPRMKTIEDIEQAIEKARRDHGTSQNPSEHRISA